MGVGPDARPVVACSCGKAAVVCVVDITLAPSVLLCKRPAVLLVHNLEDGDDLGLAYEAAKRSVAVAVSFILTDVG